jgi:two-component system sensor histidine kinase VicK
VNSCGSNVRKSETVEVIQDDENVIETILSFISRADTGIDAFVDQTRPAANMNNEHIRAAIIAAHSRGVKLRCITEITSSNIESCKELLEIVDELRHLDDIAGSFYVSNKECLIPVLVQEKGKPASQIIFWSVKEAVKQQQYVFESLWNEAISAQQKINKIEKGEMPEIIEIIRNPSAGQELAFKLIRSAKKEILVILSSINTFMRQSRAGSGQLIVEVANSRNVSVIVLTPMDEVVKKIAKELEKQSANIKIRSIEPSSRSPITVLIVDRKSSLVLELKDDTRLLPAEAAGNITYSTSQATVLSYVSMFESFMRLTKLYEDSQLKLNDKIDELEAMKGYLYEVLNEVDKFKQTKQ